MMTCVGQEDLMKWGTSGCDADPSANAETCCPIGNKFVDCLDSDCMTINFAMGKVKGHRGQGMAAAEKACPDAGFPSQAAVDATANAGTLSEGEAMSTSLAGPSQAVPMLALAAAIAFSLMNFGNDVEQTNHCGLVHPLWIVDDPMISM